MKSVKTVTFSILLSLLLGGCERYEILETPTQFKAKLVAFASIDANQKSGSLMLNKTIPVIGGSDTITQPDYVHNAEVYLIHQNKQYAFVYDEVMKRYEVTLDSNGFKSGEQYTIKVSTPNETIVGSTRIPDAPKIECTISTETIFITGFYFTGIRFKYKLLSATSNILLLPSLIGMDSSENPLRISGGAKPVILVKNGETVEQLFQSTDNFPLLGIVARVKLQVVACDDAYAAYYNKFASFDGGSFVEPFTQPKIT
ncbi:MAG: DUF4249 family protein, partial [Bacteroidetes bacterium]